MNEIILRPLHAGDEKAFMDGLELFSDMDGDWYSFIWELGIKFETHLQTLDDRFHGRNLAPGLVPDSMLYAFLNGKIIGRSSIRHDLNDYLRKVGGHIGYAVATPYRMKGIATEILKQSLIYCKDVLKLDRVLVTCDENNEGSIKTILKNGGEYQDKVLAKSETIYTNRYWINLK
ncbi:MAG: GNAT family N-acetyltransferase [Rhizobacter sp.]|nr:GNAT family N-acetyltransferase [Bacteriovorax sp.]